MVRFPCSRHIQRFGLAYVLSGLQRGAVVTRSGGLWETFGCAIPKKTYSPFSSPTTSGSHRPCFPSHSVTTVFQVFLELRLYGTPASFLYDDSYASRNALSGVSAVRLVLLAKRVFGSLCAEKVNRGYYSFSISFNPCGKIDDREGRNDAAEMSQCVVRQKEFADR